FDNATLEIIGKSIAETLRTEKSILIIRDTRESGIRIQEELAKGILNAGLTPVFGGVMPTSAASFIMQSGKYSAAIVISASHNPYMDNGIKIFNSKGFKLKDNIELKIEKKIKKYLNLNIIVLNKNIKIKEDSQFLKFYEQFIVEKFAGISLKGKTIVVDCANGSSYKCAPYVLKKLGAKIIVLNNKPDGKNINLNCGALHPEYAAKIVKECKAFCGFAFDGDADRLICIDESGVIKDGDYFLASMAVWLKNKKKLKNDTLVTTVMANMGLLETMRKEHIKTVSAKVGDRYVIEDMKRYKASFGGEQSGHFIFKDILTTGDGLLSSVMLLAALNDGNKTMSEFMNIIKKFPQVLVNKKVKEKVPIKKLLNSYKLIKDYEKVLGVNGRILVRYSGTENFVRIMVEGKDIKTIKTISENVLTSIENEITSYNQ
ncbi:MAG: phosphoglucosamine mutase, partial [Endomicrobium sp.]|nr:phosphoglucosamine mutase [Endomicrobium sp.]